jgi:hypothetical protein
MEDLQRAKEEVDIEREREMSGVTLAMLGSKSFVTSGSYLGLSQLPLELVERRIAKPMKVRETPSN